MFTRKQVDLNINQVFAELNQTTREKQINISRKKTYIICCFDLQANTLLTILRDYNSNCIRGERLMQ